MSSERITGWRAAATLLQKAVCLLLLNVAAGLALLAWHQSSLNYQPWETDSVLLRMPDGESRDLVILGASHAYLLSRFKANHEILEETLGMRVFNMAMPSGGGVVPARLYLETFLEQGNRARAVAYFLDPFVLFSPGASHSHKFVYYEPLQAGFLWKLAINRYPVRRIFTYAKSKFSADWLFQGPEPLYEHNGTLEGTRIAPEHIKERIRTLYPGGLHEHEFVRLRADLVAIAERCRQEDMPLFLIIPPTLLGPEPGAARMLDWLSEIQAQYGFQIHDLCGVMPEQKYYYNLDHLNTAGVGRFIGEFVRPIVRKGLGAGGGEQGGAAPQPEKQDGAAGHHPQAENLLVGQ